MIYLAGPIDDIDRSDAKGWRHEFAGLVQPYACYDPCSAFRNVNSSEFGNVNRINAEALDACEIVFANLTGPGRAIGTIRELEVARQKGKIVVVAIDDTIPRAGLADCTVTRYYQEAADTVKNYLDRQKLARDAN